MNAVGIYVAFLNHGSIIWCLTDPSLWTKTLEKSKAATQMMCVPKISWEWLGLTVTLVIYSEVYQCGKREHVSC